MMTFFEGEDEASDDEECIPDHFFSFPDKFEVIKLKIIEGFL